LYPAQNFLYLGRGRPGQFDDFLDGSVEVPVIIEVANDARANLPLLLGEVGKPDLPLQVIL
jgi:hypothetical protein